MFLITGVTGHVGSVAASELLDAGAKVRVFVRSEAKAEAWRARGAEVAIGELGDEAALEAAMRGVEAAYLLLPAPMPPPADGAAFFSYQRDLGAKIARAVGQSGVPHVVLLSSIGAQHPDGTGPIKGLHFLENDLRATGARVTAVRPCYFMENLAGSAPAITGAGILPSFLLPDKALHMVATPDIGHVVAGALLHPAAGSTTIELAGPVDYTVAEQAAVLSTVLGKTINPVIMPDSQALQGLLGAGLPQAMAELYAEMYVGLNAGRVAFESPATLVRGPTPLEACAAGLFGSQPSA